MEAGGENGVGDAVEGSEVQTDAVDPVVAPTATDHPGHLGLRVDPLARPRRSDGHDDRLADPGLELALEQHALGGEIDGAPAEQSKVRIAHDFTLGSHLPAQHATASGLEQDPAGKTKHGHLGWGWPI